MSNRLDSMPVTRDRQRSTPVTVFASVHGHAQATVVLGDVKPAVRPACELARK